MSRDTMLKRPASAVEATTDRPAIAPAVDVYENKEELLLVADVPGVLKDDLAVHFEKGQLTLEAKRTAATGGDARGFDYRRSFLVPQGIDADKIVAELQNGVLEVHLPKAAALKPRSIPISMR